MSIVEACFLQAYLENDCPQRLEVEVGIPVAFATRKADAGQFGEHHKALQLDGAHLLVDGEHVGPLPDQVVPLPDFHWWLSLGRFLGELRRRESCDNRPIDSPALGLVGGVDKFDQELGWHFWRHPDLSRGPSGSCHSCGVPPEDAGKEVTCAGH